MTARRLLGPALAALACLPSVAAADGVEWSGLSCGMVVTNDPTGVINQDPNVYTGVITAGPVAGADVTGSASHHEVADFTVHCWIQVNNGSFNHGSAAPPLHCDASGFGAAGGACVVTFTASALDNVYLCTRVDITHSPGTEFYRYNAGPSSGSPVCEVAIGTRGMWVVVPTVIPEMSTA